MIAKNTVPVVVKERRARVLRPKTFPSHFGISNLPIDIMVETIGTPIGAKCSGRIDEKPGGCAVHGCQVALANEIDAGCGGVQTQEGARRFGRLAAEKGIKAFVVKRENVPPAISVAKRNGGGEFEITSQRMAPVSVAELTTLTSRATKLPRSIIVGPTPLDEESFLFHEMISHLAECRAMVVHASILHHPQHFRLIAKHYHFVAMNFPEACIVDENERDIEKLACRVRFLLDGVPFAITNGAERGGLVWDENAWHRIEPCAVTDEICTVGAGDVWTAAYVLSKWYLGAKPKSAASYACIASAAWICRRQIPPYCQ
jgi:sugar/nucleoside kinase (ribokinase family)